MSVFLDVLDFHHKFGCYRQHKPALPKKKIRNLRIALIREEFEELVEATRKKNLIKIADALADLQYVTNGMAIACGIDLEDIHDEVHGTNMKKEGGKIRKDGKVLKPEGWKPPQIKEILQKQSPLFSYKKV